VAGVLRDARGFTRLSRARAPPPGAGAGLVLYFRLAPSREEAERAAIQYLEHEYHQPFHDLAGRYCALGPPATCVEAIGQFVEAGVREVALIPTCPPAMFMDQVRQAAADVLPHFAR
jgi:alkanesulfonate monooxygenase SsuD/methylene tetrahydromethanopterin reductase-like flavin-dependent oxidoreductase (luciferase family)